MIVQTIKPSSEKLKLKPIEIDMAGLSPEQRDKKLENVAAQPQVYYFDTEIPAQSIKKLIIDNVNFLPIFSLTFIDTMGLLHDVGFPTDNATIKIVIPTNNKLLANIFMEFKIQKFQVEMMKDAVTRRITMTGVCNIEKLLISEFKSYPNMSSFEIYQDFANQTGLGLMSNITTSSDKMNWINFGWKNTYFLQDLVNKAWVGETGFLWGFVDLYYNLNFIDLEKALSQDITEIKWVNTNIFDDQLSTEDPSNAPLISPMLTNSDSQKMTNSYFVGEKILNKSTETSLNRGYLRNVHYYDIDGNWEEKSGAYKSYVLDTITTPGSENTSIYLKGDPGNLDFYNANQSYHYMDKLDTKNMYPDFLWAKLQNEENLQDLQKITMQIILPKPNFNIKRFDKVNLVFANNNVTVAGNAKNIKLNGQWLVTGMYYEWNGSILYQYVNIVKRELTFEDL